MDKGTLLIVTAPHFAAGLVYKERAAPIIKYMENWNFDKIQVYCSKRGWKCRTIEEIKQLEDREWIGNNS